MLPCEVTINLSLLTKKNLRTEISTVPRILLIVTICFFRLIFGWDLLSLISKVFRYCLSLLLSAVFHNCLFTSSFVELFVCLSISSFIFLAVSFLVILFFQSFFFCWIILMYLTVTNYFIEILILKVFKFKGFYC